MAGALPLPSADAIVPRVLAPTIVDRSDQFYYLSQDYQLLSILTLRFARSWVDFGDYELAEEYIDRAFRYDRIRFSFYEGSIEQLEASIDISQNLVIVIAGETALVFAAGYIGPAAVLASDLFQAYVDYSIDVSVRDMSVDKALRRQLTKLVVKQVFRLTTVGDALGDPVTEYVGKDSGLYQQLEGLMLTPSVRAEIVRTVANSSAKLLIQAATIDAKVLANTVIERLEKTVAGDLQ